MRVPSAGHCCSQIDRNDKFCVHKVYSFEVVRYLPYLCESRLYVFLSSCRFFLFFMYVCVIIACSWIMLFLHQVWVVLKGTITQQDPRGKPACIHTPVGIKHSSTSCWLHCSIPIIGRGDCNIVSYCRGYKWKQRNTFFLYKAWEQLQCSVS